jgi:hypothetical protein
LIFLAVYGPLSVIILMIVWGASIILAFALIYQAMGPRFQASGGPVGFSTLLYMSGSTFLTLGLGDVTSADPVGRLFVLLEAASGYIFLAFIITYMPVLEQAYGAREVGNLLIHSRAGSPPNAVRLLQRYAGPEPTEVLRGNLREAERWMAETLQSHVSHPVLAFYRAQRLGQAWLISVATVLDACALLIVFGDGLVAAQAKLTYEMGLRLLEDLVEALGLAIDPHCHVRLTERELAALLEAVASTKSVLVLDSSAVSELLDAVHRYDRHLVTLANWLVIELPDLVPRMPPAPETQDTA